MHPSSEALPPETTDEIIGCLHDSPAALAACSLVHSEWKHRAQILLFTRVVLRDSQAYAALLHLMRSDARIAERHCQNTKHLEILDDRSHPYAHQLPLTLCRKFPALRSIACHNAQWHEKTHLPPRFFIPLSTFSGVVSLELHACESRAFRDFVRFVCAFGGLRDLTLVRANLGKRSPIDIAPTVKPRGSDLQLRNLRTEHLVSEDSALAELLSWLKRTPSGQEETRTIRDLRVNPQETMLQTSFHAPMEGLLSTLGSSLIDLDMPVLLHDIGTGLESNNQLRTLVLRHTFREEWGIAWTKIGLMLQTMKSVHLRSFELVFTIFRGTGPAGGRSMDLADFNINWGPINEMISNKEFGALEKATVTLEWHLMDTLPPGSAEHMQSMIEEGMKQLDWYKRGILTITHNKHPFTLPPEPKHPSAQ